MWPCPSGNINNLKKKVFFLNLIFIFYPWSS